MARPLANRFPLKFTLLHLAAQGGHDDVISWLLQHGADIDAQSIALCGCNSWQGIPPFWTPLHVAICHSHEKTVKLLLAHNASLQTSQNGESQALHTAAAKGLTSTIRHLSTLPGFNVNVKDSMGRTPLDIATNVSRSLDTTKALLGVGADVQGGGEDGRFSYTPLWNALSHGDLEVAVMLLEAGAKPFAHSDKDGEKVAPFRQQLQRRQRELHTPLLKSTLQDSTPANRGQRGVLHRKVIRALLDFGCDINETFRYGECRTPLSLAVRNSDSATVRLLLKRGAKANVKDVKPSALWHALFHRASASLDERVDKVTALLEHGADLLDQTIIHELVIRRSPRALVDAVADTLGPENLTDPNKIPGVLAICCIFQKPKLYDSIKKYAQPQARATDQDIRYALGQAARQKRANVPAFLDEMRPGLTVDVVLDQWRAKMSSSLVEWLEEIKGLEGGE